MNFSNLRSIIKTQKDFQRETYSMDAMEKRSRQAMRMATSEGSLEDVKVQRMVGQARTELDLVESRRGHVEAGLSRCFRELKTEATALEREYNKLVKARREAMRSEIENALRPFMDGNHRDLEIILNSTNWPCLYEIGRAAWSGFDAQNSTELAEQLSSFMRHARRFSKVCNLDIGEAASE